LFYVRTSWVARARAADRRARVGGGGGVVAARPVPRGLPGLPRVAAAPGRPGVDHRAAPVGRAGRDAWCLARRPRRPRPAASGRFAGRRAGLVDPGGAAAARCSAQRRAAAGGDARAGTDLGAMTWGMT